MHRRASGFALLESLVAGSFLAVATLGLSAAMVSGLTLEGGVHRTMSQVSTAQNLMEQIRLDSQANFNGLVSSYDKTSTAAHSSIGLTSDSKRSVTVNIPLSEADVPGGLDLNANGTIDATVDALDARILVVDIEGSNRLRLRTAVFDFGKLPGIVLARDKGDEEAPVQYGETRVQDYVTPPRTPAKTVNTDPPPQEPQPGDGSGGVSVTASGFNGKSAELVLVNDSTGDRKPTSLTVAPSEDLYFKSVALDGHTIHKVDPSQDPGTVTIELDTNVALAPGEATLVIADFYRMKKGKKKKRAPKKLTVTVAFDDGSVVSTVISR